MDRHEYPDGIVRLIILTNTSALYETGDDTYINIFHALELSILIVTALSSLVTIYFGCTMREAHSNLLNILHFYEIFYLPFLVARVILMLIERQIFSFTGTLNDDLPFLLCGLFQGWFLMTHAVKIPAMLCERYFASLHIEDYEREQRIWISIFLITVILLSSFIMTLLTHFDLGSYYSCTVPAFILQVFIYIHFKNKKVERQLASKVDYTLSRKYQLTENWKVLRLIRMKIVTTIVIVCICCFMLSLVMSVENRITQAKISMVLQLCFSGFPLIINVAIIYSFKSWRRKLLRTRRDSNTRNEYSHQQMGDIHFAQIESAWK